MKILILNLIVGLLVGDFSHAADSARVCKTHAKVLVVSYNLLNSNVHKPEQFPEWKVRGPLIAKWAVDNHVDIFAIQEVLPSMLTTVKAGMKDYVVVGRARSENPENGEYSAILFRRDRFKRLDDGTFWLSPTPGVMGSRGWDAAHERICTWVQLEDVKTKKRFFVFNTHFDHLGKVAQRESAKLIVQKILEISENGDVILAGDFNVPDSDSVLEPLKVLKLARTHSVVAPVGGERSFVDGRRLDHLFSSGGLVACSYKIFEPKSERGLWLSDHLPVAVEFSRP